MMNAMVRVGLGFGMTALVAMTVGCGTGSSSAGGFAPKAPHYGGEVVVEAEAMPSQPGYASTGSSTPAADMAPPSAPMSVDSTARREEGAARPSRRVEVDDRPGLGTQWGETRFS